MADAADLKSAGVILAAYLEVLISFGDTTPDVFSDLLTAYIAHCNQNINLIELKIFKSKLF